MIRPLRPLIAIAASSIAVFLSACAATPAESAAPQVDEPMLKTILITRHAEKAAYSADPSLSPDGLHRAEALSRLAETQSVGTIITSQFRRTIETAAPLANRLGILSRVVNATARPDALQQLADDILAQADPNAENGTVLVVGHSNTVPLIIKQLGGPGEIFLSEEDFGDLFILTISDDGSVQTQRIRYGD